MFGGKIDITKLGKAIKLGGTKMIVKIKNFKVDMEVKNTGIELEIRSTKDEFLGDMILNKKGITWCPGKTTKKNGIIKNLEDIIGFFYHTNR